MKKCTKGILLGLAVLIGAIALIGCTHDPNASVFDYDNTKPTNPMSQQEDIADYYGCPNSNRVKKLNLKKARRLLHT